MIADRTKLHANEIKRRLQRLKREALYLEPRLAARINNIGNTLMKYRSELLDKKTFLMEFLNEIYYDIQTYLYVIKPLMNSHQEELQTFFEQNNIFLTEYYYYTKLLPTWFSKDDGKFSNWIEKLILEEYRGDDQGLIFALTREINAKSEGSASHRYILDLSLATDLLISHIPSEFQPVFVQLKGIPVFRDGQRNPDFIHEQQRWYSTLSYWGVKRALLISHNAEVSHPEHLSRLADAILKESSDHSEVFTATISFPDNK